MLTFSFVYRKMKTNIPMLKFLLGHLDFRLLIELNRLSNLKSRKYSLCMQKGS